MMIASCCRRALLGVSFGVLATLSALPANADQITFVSQGGAYQQAQTVALHELDFACAVPRQMMELNGEQAGQFKIYDTAQGQSLLQRVVSRLVDVGFFRQEPAVSEITQFARYPDSVVCRPEVPEKETTESRR